ncbi:MAG: L-histidine N(alpha)-methyltransferase [Candidatus Thermoplasmatota archaeon]|nr:L-histidine N(alpha)-methyltransferase [Candidatus Thermoplasmatota archaeon]
MPKKLVNRNPAVSDFRAEVLLGMEKQPRSISPKFFYDSEGSRLFDEITRLPEYYPTESEISILREKCSELNQLSMGSEEGIELGSGNGKKAAILLDCFGKMNSYILVDISITALEEAMDSLSSKFSSMDISAICVDYRDGKFMKQMEMQHPGKRMLIFLGSTIGNMEPEEAMEFLKECRNSMMDGDRFLVGVDMKKDPEIIEKAYNDSSGVTAKFNLNLVERMRRELGAEIPENAFAHMAYYNEGKGRIEMHLLCTMDFSMKVAGKEFIFRKGETIHTENSYKYSAEEFSGMLKKAGFTKNSYLTDSRKFYGLFVADA